MTLDGTFAMYWKEAIKSLIDQDYQDWELVFVTNDSLVYQNVVELKTEWGLNVQAHLDFSSSNRSERFRKAVGFATGITCVVLDADDLLKPGALRTVEWCLSKEPEIKFFTTSHECINPDGSYFATNVASAYSNTLDAMCNGFQQKHFWGFPNNPEYWPHDFLKSPYLCEDFFMFSMLARRSTDILPIPNICYQWRVHMHQLTQRRSDEIERMLQSLMKANQLFAKGKGPGFKIKQILQAADLTERARRLFIPD